MASHQAKKPKKDKELTGAVLQSKVADEKEQAPSSLCERIRCADKEILCILEACNACISRSDNSAEGHNWYHMSIGEHVCNVCLEFYLKSQNPGYNDFVKWKRVWSANARSDPLISTFISDMLLPHWLQCNRCMQWREMGRFFKLDNLSAELFMCPKGCDKPEDPRVAAAKKSDWIGALLYPPYLTQSPAAQFIKGYFSDGVGMSAVEQIPSETAGDNIFRPFHEAYGAFHALSVRPDVMDFDETEEFKEFACAQQMYLCLRNLVIALWVQNCTEWLTVDKCRHSVICRGLVRVRCVQELERIIRFLTLRGVINYGILPYSPPIVFHRSNPPNVIVIGAGMSGLAAAHHLYRHGLKLTVLEARKRVGGRVYNTRLLNGGLLSLGVDIITGSVNNPLAHMAKQAKLTVQEFPISTITVLDKLNKIIPAETMRKVENRFLQIIDQIYDWSSNSSPQDPDICLQEKINEVQAVLDNDDETFNEQERLLLGMHIKTLGMNIGCELDKVSAKMWNAHENSSQFSGPSFIIKQGIGAMLTKMSGPLDVQFEKQVTLVEYNENKVNVKCADDSTYVCDKVIVTVPLKQLQSKSITFDPQLPKRKVDAINALGCGKLEKVVMHFKKKFWAPKMHGVRMFTSTSILKKDSSLVHMFYDMSNPHAHLLAAYVYGEKTKLPASEALEEQSSVDDKTTDKSANRCLDVLRIMFPNAPNPVSVTMSQWSNDSLAGSNACYIPVGVSDDNIDILAEPVNEKILFAGEATHRIHPRSLTGAYLSGVREAVRIL